MDGNVAMKNARTGRSKKISGLRLFTQTEVNGKASVCLPTLSLKRSCAAEKRK